MNSTTRILAFLALIVTMEMPLIGQENGERHDTTTPPHRGRGHYLGLRISPTSTAVRDATLSPLLYEGYSFPIGLTYRIVGSSGEHGVDIDFAFSSSNSLTMTSSATSRLEVGSFRFEESIARQNVGVMRYTYTPPLVATVARSLDITLFGRIDYRWIFRRYWFEAYLAHDPSPPGIWAQDGHLGLHLGIRADGELSVGNAFASLSSFLGGVSLRSDYGGVARQIDGLHGLAFIFHDSHPVSFIDHPFIEFVAGVAVPVVDMTLWFVPDYSFQYYSYGRFESSSLLHRLSLGAEVRL